MGKYDLDKVKQACADAYDRIVEQSREGSLETNELARALVSANVGTDYLLSLEVDHQTMALTLWEYGSVLGEAVQQFHGLESLMPDDTYFRAQMQNELAAGMCATAHLLFRAADVETAKTEENESK